MWPEVWPENCPKISNSCWFPHHECACPAGGLMGLLIRPISPPTMFSTFLLHSVESTWKAETERGFLMSGKGKCDHQVVLLGAIDLGWWPLGQHQNSLWADKINDPSGMGCNNVLFYPAEPRVVQFQLQKGKESNFVHDGWRFHISPSSPPPPPPHPFSPIRSSGRKRMPVKEATRPIHQGKVV